MQDDSRVKAKSDLGSDAESPAEMTGPDPILDDSGAPIDEVWAGEFRAFFFGEGCFQIQGDSPTKKRNLSTACIGTRSDDLPALMEIHRRLGGGLKTSPYPKDPTKFMCKWHVSNADDCLRVARLLEGSRIPFRKANELQIWKTATQIRKDRRNGTQTARAKLTPEDRLYFIWAEQKLKRLKKGIE